MALGDNQLERYARQVIIPGVGTVGQEKLLASHVLVVGYPPERAIAQEYLAGAGVNVCTSVDEPVDCIVACRLDAISDDELARFGNRDTALAWYVLTGRDLTAGCIARFDGRRPTLLRPTENELHAPETDALGSVAACDTAASTIALLLGWQSEPEIRQEHRLG